MIQKTILTIPVLEGIEKSEGCPLCYLWSKTEQDYLDHVLTNELTMDPGFREKLVAAKGFCNRHMHLIYKATRGGHTEDGLGYALYMQDVVQSVEEKFRSLVLRSLNGLPKAPDRNVLQRRVKRKKALLSLADGIKRATRGKRPCPVCEYLWSLDEIHLDTLLQMLDDEDFQEEFKSSKGLCLPHYEFAIEMLSRSKLRKPLIVARVLTTTQIGRFRSVAHYLSEFIRKKDWKFRNEPAGPEVNADPMSLNLLAGTEGLSRQTQNSDSNGDKGYKPLKK